MISSVVSLFELIFVASIAGTLLWLIVSAGQRCLRNRISPRLTHLLLLMVAMRFAMVMAPVSPLSIMNLAPHIPPVVPATTQPTSFQVRLSTQESLIPSKANAEAFQKPSESTPFRLESFNVLTVIWGLGVCVLMLLLVQRIRNTWRLIDASVDANCPRLIRLIEETRHLFESPKPLSVRVSEQINVPSIAGMFRPTIILPRWSVEELEDQELKLVLTHEMVHGQRYDLLTGCATHLVRIVHWFNPILWWIDRRAAEIREVTCDEKVIDCWSRAGTPRPSIAKVYGLTILKIAQRFEGGRSNQPGLIGVIGFCRQDNSIRERILMLNNSHPSTWLRTVFTISVVATLLMVGFTSAQDKERQKEGQQALKQGQGAPQPGIELSGEHASQTKKSVEQVVTATQVYEVSTEQFKQLMKEVELDELKLRSDYFQGVVAKEKLQEIQEFLMDEEATVLKAPMVIANDGQTASIQSGVEVPLEDGTNENLNSTTELRLIGFQLQICNQLAVSEEGRCTAGIQIENSYLIERESEKPRVFLRRLNNDFLCNDEETIVLATSLPKSADGVRVQVDQEVDRVMQIALIQPRRMTAERIDSLRRAAEAGVENPGRAIRR